MSLTRSRSYLHWRIRRRIQETAIGAKLRQRVPSISQERVEAFLVDLRTAAGTDADQGVAEWFEANSDLVARFLRLPSANFSKSAKFSK